MIVGVGVDVTSISRVSRFVRDHAASLERVFTGAEQEFCERGTSRHREARYASAFAGKEAVMKALGTGLRSDIEFADIDTRDPVAPGEVVLRRGARSVASSQGIVRIFLSVASTAHVAIASAVATSHDDDGR